MTDEALYDRFVCGYNHPFGCRMRVCLVEIRSFDIGLINHWLDSCSQCLYSRTDERTPECRSAVLRYSRWLPTSKAEHSACMTR